MNINTRSCVSFALNIIPEKILNSLKQRKKILLIAAAALGLLAAGYLAYCYCCKPLYGKKIEKKDDVKIGNKEEQKIEKKEDDKKDQSLENQILENGKEVPKKEEEKIDNDNLKNDAPEIQSKDEIQPEKKDEVQPKQPDAADEPFSMPKLLSFGKCRMGNGGGDTPNFEGIQYFKRDTVIDTDKLLTAAIACCFHTTESHQEIYNILRTIRIKIDPAAEIFGPREHYCESFNNLYNNLVRLHDALPGERKAKKVKIYWSESVEKILIPYLLKNENINVENLLFAILPGEGVAQPFQDPSMDFSHQLQFVEVGAEQTKKLAAECLNLSKKNLQGWIFFKDQEFSVLIKQQTEQIDNPLMKKATNFRALLNIRSNLLALQAQPMRIILRRYSPQDRSNFFKSLFEAPKP